MKAVLANQVLHLANFDCGANMPVSVVLGCGDGLTRTGTGDGFVSPLKGLIRGVGVLS